ncbi:MAG: hypothetical protein AAFR93_00420 [Pseudomonadota bacterium]
MGHSLIRRALSAICAWVCLTTAAPALAVVGWDAVPATSYHVAGVGMGNARLEVNCALSRTPIDVSLDIIGAEGRPDGRVTFAFDTGTEIDVIAVRGSVTAVSTAGRRILDALMGNFRNGGAVTLRGGGMGPVTFTLSGAQNALKGCR